jgi:hypothetical protein
VIGLVLMFFVLALTASSIVEVISRLAGKRAANLESALAAMLAGTAATDQDVEKALKLFKDTSIYDSAKGAAGKSLIRRKWKRPSYLSAKSFADAITEIRVAQTQLPAGVNKRFQAIEADVGKEITKVKAGLEHWFDESMERVSGAYKRWSTMLLFVFGLAIAVAANASAFHVADRLWHDPVTRQAVADSASKVAAEGQGATELKSIVEATNKLEALHLPVGWSKAETKDWRKGSWWPGNWTWNQSAHVLGWLVSAFLVMLGAPFWFDILSKAVSLRSSGGKPEVAPKDATSETSRLLKTG